MHQKIKSESGLYYVLHQFRPSLVYTMYYTSFYLRSSLGGVTNQDIVAHMNPVFKSSARLVTGPGLSSRGPGWNLMTPVTRSALH